MNINNHVARVQNAVAAYRMADAIYEAVARRLKGDSRYEALDIIREYLTHAAKHEDKMVEDLANAYRSSEKVTA